MNLFSPDYGAASSHIAALTQEREDFVAASIAQATRIAALEKQVRKGKASLTLEEYVRWGEWEGPEPPPPQSAAAAAAGGAAHPAFRRLQRQNTDKDLELRELMVLEAIFGEEGYLRDEDASPAAFCLTVTGGDDGETTVQIRVAFVPEYPSHLPPTVELVSGVGVEDVAFVNNVVTNVASGISLLNRDNGAHPTTGVPKLSDTLKRILIQDNVIEVDRAAMGGDGYGIFLGSGPLPATASKGVDGYTHDITIKYNTVVMRDGNGKPLHMNDPERDKRLKAIQNDTDYRDLRIFEGKV